MKKILLYSFALTALLNLVQYAGSWRPVGALVTPNIQSNRVDAAGTVLAASSPATLPPQPAANDTVAQQLDRAQLKSTYAELYLVAQNRTGTPWQLVAAVHVIESGQAGPTSRTSGAGAVGPFQFMPSTWRAYALDGDSDGVARITDVSDAAVTAGRYLAASGAASGNYRGALYHYNHSWTYVSRVMAVAQKLGI